MHLNLDDLTALFAKRFLGLKPTRDRFMRPDGSWMPRWRFAPFICLEDALLLLERAASEFRLKSCGPCNDSLGVDARLTDRHSASVSFTETSPSGSNGSSMRTSWSRPARFCRSILPRAVSSIFYFNPAVAPKPGVAIV